MRRQEARAQSECSVYKQRRAVQITHGELTRRPIIPKHLSVVSGGQNVVSNLTLNPDAPSPESEIVLAPLKTCEAKKAIPSPLRLVNRRVDPSGTSPSDFESTNCGVLPKRQGALTTAPCTKVIDARQTRQHEDGSLCLNPQAGSGGEGFEKPFALANQPNYLRLLNLRVAFYLHLRDGLDKSAQQGGRSCAGENSDAAIILARQGDDGWRDAPALFATCGAKFYVPELLKLETKSVIYGEALRSDDPSILSRRQFIDSRTEP